MYPSLIIVSVITYTSGIITCMIFLCSLIFIYLKENEIT